MTKNKWGALIAITVLLTVTFCLNQKFALGEKVQAATFGSWFNIQPIKMSLRPSLIDLNKNEQTEICFRLQAPGSYTVKISDLTNKIIRQYGSYDLKSNTDYRINWNGTDSQNVKVKEGRYRVVISGGNYSKGSTLTVKNSVDRNPVSTGTVNVTPTTIDTTKLQKTNISFTFPKDGDYLVYIADKNDNIVRRIVNYVGELGGASYIKEWTGQDSSGKYVAPGAYYAVLKGEGANSTLPALKTAINVTKSGNDDDSDGTVSGSISVLPNTIDLTKNQSARILYTFPQTGDYSVYITDKFNTVVKRIVNYIGEPAGAAYSKDWSGQDANGAQVPGGEYYAVLRGDNANANLPVQKASIIVVKSMNDGGGDNNDGGGNNIVFDDTLAPNLEGSGSANFSGLRDNTTRFVVGFTVPKSGQIKAMGLQWKIKSGYAGPNGSGEFEYSIVKGVNSQPEFSQQVGINNRFKPDSDGAITIPMSANLVSGQKYFMVMRNVVSGASTQWSSPNTLSTRPKLYTASYQPAVCQGNSCTPWSNDNRATAPESANFMPVVVYWSDGSYTGKSMYSAASQPPVHVNSTSNVGEYIKWSMPDTAIKKIGLSVLNGGSGTIRYHLETSAGQMLAEGNLTETGATTHDWQSVWKYGTLSQAVTLENGSSYRLWFDSVGDYKLYVPYTHSRIGWPESTWGGIESYFIGRKGSGWETTLFREDGPERIYNQADLTFDFQS